MRRRGPWAGRRAGPPAGAAGAFPSCAEGPGVGGRLVAWSAVILVIWAFGFAISFVQALSILTMVGLATTLHGLFSPRVGLVGTGILCAIDSLTRVYLLSGGLLRWNTFNYLLLLFVLLRGMWMARTRWLPIWTGVALLGLLVLELAMSPARGEGAQHCLGLTNYFALIVFARQAVKSPGSWLELAFTTSLLTAVGGLVFLMRSDGLAPINPNAYSFFPLAGVLTSCAVAVLGRMTPRWFLLLMPLTVINACWTVLTASRSGILLCLIAMSFLLLKLPRMSHRVMTVGVAVVLGSVILTRFVEENEYTATRLEQTFDSSTSISKRTSGRSDLVAVGWQMFLDRPLGNGTGSFARNYARASLDQGVEFHAGREMAAHSAWVKVLAENGLPGILLLIAFCCSFVWVGWSRRKENRLPIGCMASALCGAAFMFTEFQSKPLWMICAIATVALCERPVVAVRRTVVRAMRPLNRGYRRVDRAPGEVLCH